jgi:hypothetical protein
LDQVLVTCDGVEVACHARSSARHQTITDPDRGGCRSGPQGGRRQERVAGHLIFGVIAGGLSTGEGVT